MRSLLRFGCLAVALSALTLASAGQARASLIYDNGGPDQSGGNEMTEWIQAEDFTIGTAVTLTDVRFWNLEDPSLSGYNGSISWSIYADTGTAPGALMFRGNTAGVTRTLTNTGVLGVYDEYQNDFSVGSIALAAGTYWIGLHNGDVSMTTRAEFYWETTGLNATLTGQEDDAPFDDNVWLGNGSEHAFALYSVPEPASLGLFGAGALGLVIQVRLRRRLAS